MSASEPQSTPSEGADLPSGVLESAASPGIEPFDPKDPPLPLEFFETRYQLSRTTLWRYRRAGLRAIGVGTKTFVRESDFVRFLGAMNDRRAPATAPGERKP